MSRIADYATQRIAEHGRGFFKRYPMFGNIARSLPGIPLESQFQPLL